MAVQAQQTGQVWRIGVLLPDRPGTLEAIVAGLRDLNYIDGRNVILEVRRVPSRDQLPGLASELVALKPDVIVTVTGVFALAVQSLTRTIPIVMASSGDAISFGLVASLAHPGGNVTGLTVMSPDLAAKRLQLLKEATPRAQRIGVIGCSGNAVHDAQWSAIQPAAQQMGLRLIPIFFQRPEELNPLFEMALRKEKMDAILILDCSALTSPERVVELVSKARVPALYPFPRFVQAGGLISYGPNVEKQYRRAAIFVDKILRGANPGDIPVEQPTTIDLIVNVKAARMLNIKFPPSFLGRADQLIE